MSLPDKFQNPLKFQKSMKLRNLVTSSLGSHTQTGSPPAFYSQQNNRDTQNAQSNYRKSPPFHSLLIFVLDISVLKVPP